VTADVVIVTWEARDMVLRCLERLGPEEGDVTTWVVDNGSGDGTVEAVRERFPAARVRALERNVGFGRAVNDAVRQGRAEAIVLVNDDVLAEPGLVEALVAPLAAPTVGMVAGLTLLPGSGLVDGFGIQLDATLAAYNRLRRRAPDEPPGMVAGPSGAVAAYRRAAWEAVGGFDERLFAYGEDVDLLLRLRLAGWRAAEAPEARGEHIGGATTGVDSPRQRRLAGFARGYLLRRYGVLRGRAAARALTFEAMVVGWGAARHRTLVPLRARVEGWRAAGAAGPALRAPTDALDPTIGWRDALHRLRHAR
jgi:N-acetylglucosaminyl-diphospho-decaprenol L-rhamnosyltransferase